jgi:hypothetical protein
MAKDTLGHCTLGTPAGNVTIPMLQGSRFLHDPAIQPLVPASPVFGPVNAFQGVVTPSIYLVAPAYASWFTPRNFTYWFTRSIWGQLGTWGNLQFQYANELPLQYLGYKVDRMVIHWGAGGEPVTVEMLIYPFGRRWYGSYITPTKVWGQPLMSQRIDYLGSLTGVWGGQVGLYNQLVPDVSVPHLASSDGNPYPVDYKCHPLAAQVALVQKHESTYILDSLSGDYGAWFTARFKDTSNTQVLRLGVYCTAPQREATIRLADGRIVRRYQGIRPNLSSPMVAVA